MHPEKATATRIQVRAGARRDPRTQGQTQDEGSSLPPATDLWENTRVFLYGGAGTGGGICIPARGGSGRLQGRGLLPAGGLFLRLGVRGKTVSKNTEDSF